MELQKFQDESYPPESPSDTVPANLEDLEADTKSSESETVTNAKPSKFSWFDKN